MLDEPIHSIQWFNARHLFHGRPRSVVLAYTDIRLVTLDGTRGVHFCISVYFIIVTLVVVAFDNLHSTEMK